MLTGRPGLTKSVGRMTCHERRRDSLAWLPPVLGPSSKSTPHASCSADFGVASICGHSWQVDSLWKDIPVNS